MRNNVRRFVKEAISCFQRDKVEKLLVAEFGSRQVEQTVETDIRPLVMAEFGKDNVTYVGFDVEAGPGVDVVVDLTLPNLDHISTKFDLIFCLETLEHVKRPHDAAKNLAGLLKPDGLLVISVPYYFQWHSRPHYWGLTPDGLSEILNEAGLIHACDMDPPVTGLQWDFPHTVVAVASKNRDIVAAAMKSFDSNWQNEHNDDMCSVVLRFHNKKAQNEFFAKLEAFNEKAHMDCAIPDDVVVS